MMAVPWDPKAEAIARLPGVLGGCGLRLLDAPGMAEATYWATWIQTTKRVQQLAAKAGRPIEQVQGHEEATQAKQQLSSMGIEADELGGVKLAQANVEAWQSTGWSKDKAAEELVEDTAFYSNKSLEGPKPPRKVLGKLWRDIEAGMAAKLWQDLDVQERDLHWDAGGQGAGSIWCAAQHLTAGASGEVWFANPHFQLASAMRMLAVDPPRGTTCNLAASGQAGQASKDGEDEKEKEKHRGWTGARCGVAIGKHAAHCFLCKQGPARMRPHRALQRALANCVKAADGRADLEREDPSLAKWDPKQQEWQQGKVDLWCSFPGVPLAFLLDVTIRCSEAERYSNGSNLELATKEKAARYGSKVSCMAYGTMGRASGMAQQTLFRMAEAAGWSRYKPDQAKAIYMAWQQVLQRTVVWSECDVALSSLGRWRR